MVANQSHVAQTRLDQDLNAHIRALGLANVTAYQEWCGRQGFSRKLYKSRAARTRERAVIARTAVELRLSQNNRQRKSGIDSLEAICDRRWKGGRHSPDYLYSLNAFVEANEAPQLGPRLDRRLLKRLIQHLSAKRAKLLTGSPVMASLGNAKGNTYIEAVFLVALHCRDWIRSFEDWTPPSHSARRQLASLLRHLFVRYDDMPAFFDSVWLQPPSTVALRRRSWYRHVGRGENIRHCDLPLEYTKKMAYHFMRAPDDLTIDQALRWGQVIAMGGDERLARAIGATRLGREFEHEDFWRTVVQWFAVQPMLALQEAGPIIDYLHDQRFVPVWNAAGDAAPAQPNLSMKGRSAQSLLRQVQLWHRKLAKDNSQQLTEWKPSGIAAFELVEGNADGDNARIWTIRELLSKRALVVEGRQLHHCVASYGRCCASGQCSIWTVEVESSAGVSKRLTVEVLGRSRSIVQARGNCNRMPTDRERKLLQRWALQAGLAVRI